MESEQTEYSYDAFLKGATGCAGPVEEYRTISYPFDRYDIIIKLSPQNEFLGILEIKLNKDFLSHKQRLGIQNYVDVDRFYEE
jgi:hypothetical protein